MGPENWCLQTYATLRRSGFDATCSNRFERFAINVAHVASIKPFSVPCNSFVVGVRADYPPIALAQIHVVQNQSQADSSSVWIPHWPQPGLVPRSSNRDGIKTVAYAGQGYYLAGRRTEWEAECRRLGLNFRMMTPRNWHDFSEVDIAIAIRTFDDYAYDKKPPTKLFNAWHAGVPCIAGPDSAYQQVGSPGVDYLIARTFSTAVSSIERLCHDPLLYQQIVANGQQSVSNYSREKIADVWTAFFDVVARPRFADWCRVGDRSRSRWMLINSGRLARTLLKKARQKLLGPAGFKR